MRLLKLVSIVTALFIFFFLNPLKAEQFSNFKALPSWVKQTQIPQTYQVPEKQLRDGVYYLLVDRQVLVKPEDTRYFTAFAAEVVNQQGIEYFSQINIGFDPVYQNLLIHDFYIKRSGKRINQLDTASFKLLNQESELENNIYNGRKKLNILLQDLRVGDVIYYSYQIQGRNPVYQDLFAYRTSLNWSVPVEKVNVRIDWQKPSKLLHYFTGNETTPLEINQTDKGKEFKIVKTQITPVPIEEDTPDWFSPWTDIQFSETQNWQTVAAWAADLYQGRFDSNDELTEVVTQIKQQANSTEQQTSLALQFVQNEIRYVGIEFGENSHRPSKASETLQRRYGDCKDKTVLLIAILKQLGIQAYPALVDTDSEHTINHNLPGVDAFNHVITQVKIADNTFWLDPTRTYQYGHLNQIYQPDYGYALIADKRQNSLTEMVRTDDYSGASVKEQFFIPKDNNQAVTLTVETHYKGWRAANQRRKIESDGLAQIEKSYLEYYQKEFGNVAAAETIRYQDDTTNNQITLFESYTLTDFWQQEDDKLLGNFYTNSVASYLDKPDSLERKQPFYQTHPVNSEHTIMIEFESDTWRFSDDELYESNAFFDYRYRAQYDKSNQQLTLSYRYQSKAGFIPAADFSEYVQALKRARNTRYYEISKGMTNKTKNSEEIVLTDELKYTLIVFSILGAYILIAVIWYLTKSPQQAESKFYPVSAKKFVFMYIVSFGFYGCYWFYKNFQFVKLNQKSNIQPFWRGVFSLFWYYPLWQWIEKAKTGTDKSGLYLPGAILATAYLIFSILASASTNAFAYVMIFIPAVLLLPMVNKVNKLNPERSKAYAKNSNLNALHFALAFCFLAFISLELAPGLQLLPSNQVINGSQLWQHDKTKMVENKVIEQQEHIELFYSSALLSHHADGNGFTGKGVFSYWLEDNTFQLEKANFKEISSIKTNWGDEHTVITLERKDGSSFDLYITASDKQDEKFEQALRMRWQQQNK